MQEDKKRNAKAPLAVADSRIGPGLVMPLVAKRIERQLNSDSAMVVIKLVSPVSGGWPLILARLETGEPLEETPERGQITNSSADVSAVRTSALWA